jgi:ABC-type amino acid transport substrate-binding protein
VLDFPNILLSLEAGKVDVAAFQFEYNPDRAQKYLYGAVGYTTFPPAFGRARGRFQHTLA